MAELAEGDLVEASADFASDKLPEGGWLLVRSSLEDRVEVMSEKPLEYEAGWLAVGPPALEESAEDAVVELAPIQLGDKVAARVYVETHPILDNVKKLPIFKERGLPSWMPTSVAEIYTGRVAGVVKRGRYLVQRPSGAMPERVASVPEKIVVPRQRLKQALYAGLLGLAASMVVGVIMHFRRWMRGESYEFGKVAAPNLVGWCTLVVVFITPILIFPCYLLANSQAATFSVVVFLNMLLYGDLFSD